MGLLDRLFRRDSAPPSIILRDEKPTPAAEMVEKTLQQSGQGRVALGSIDETGKVHVETFER